MSNQSTTVRIGTITPSSNTVLEPITFDICRDLPNVTLHFSRFSVTSISTKDDALAQFNLTPMLHSARLLADAKLDRIIWSGTSAGWLGLEADQELCRAIENETGVPATTSVIALFEAFRTIGAKKIGLVTPYLDNVQQKIIETFESHGFATISEQHCGLENNFSFSTVNESTIESMIRTVAKSQPDAITVFCTNLRGASVVTRMENETDIPVFDTVATGLWKSLVDCGVDMTPLKMKGRIFQIGETSKSGFHR